MRFQSRYCYTADTHFHTETTSDDQWQPTPTGTHPPLPTNGSSIPKSSGRRLIHNALANGNRIDEEPAAPNKAYVKSDLSDSELHEQMPAFSNTARSPYDGSAVPASAEITQREVWSAVHQRLPHELLRALIDASQHPGYLKSLPSTTFIDILEILHPEEFVAGARKIYRDLHPSQVEALGVSQLHDVFAYYMINLRQIIEKRLVEGGKTAIEEWRFLLQLAASTGDGDVALVIWTDMVNRDIKPDLDCYNLYFKARCWSGAYLPQERHKLRVIPYNLELRRARKYEAGHVQRLQGYRTGPAGVKDEVKRMFTFMVNRGIMADAKTFGLLMIGLSREGDMTGVNSVLKRVWDVAVDSVVQQDQDPKKPASLARESPLYPTSDTLHTVAHIFGSNNELGTALRVVDYISRRYSITIGPRVWDELFEWAYVLSTPRYGVRKEDGASSGQLPLKSIERLWDTMVSPPYNVRPNMRMHNYYCVNLWHRQMLDEMLRIMRAGLALYRSHAAGYEELRHFHGMTSTEPFEERNMSSALSIMFSHQNIALGALIEHRNFLMISRWLRLLLGGNRWAGEVDRILVWERQELPNVVREFWHFRPRPIMSYYIATGKVEITTVSNINPLGSNPPKRGFEGVHFLRLGYIQKQNAIARRSGSSLVSSGRFRPRQREQRLQEVTRESDYDTLEAYENNE